MRDFFVFDSLDSILDIFWDILIVCVVCKVGLLYFIATFTTWGGHRWDMFLLFARVASTIVWARLFVHHYDLPKVRWFRLAIGFVCLLFTVAAEGGVALFLHRHYDGLMWSTPAETKIAYGTLLASYCLVPLALLGKNTEAPRKRQTPVRQEKDVKVSDGPSRVKA
ncbi:hypothetical protein PG997_007020 [Apiospora hydei]|uniref:Uncharacterized protein n=1 Tax=Apiospora hydei TaxID=1337664 RepID=A0ABR1WQD4_9PEZI